MTKAEKQNALNAHTIGYFSGWGGIEIKVIEYGINDYVVFTPWVWSGQRPVHRAKIHYTNFGAYFVYSGRRINLNEIIRV